MRLEREERERGCALCILLCPIGSDGNNPPIEGKPTSKMARLLLPVVDVFCSEYAAAAPAVYLRVRPWEALHQVLKMSYMLPHLHNGWQVDQAILSEEDRVVVIRFGHDWDPTCMKMDEVLYSIAEKVKNFAVIYLVDITEVPDFNKMYELYDPCTVMFFFRNKHIMIDLGTGNNNKINWAMEDKQEMIDIIETVYRGARKGRGLVVSPKDYSTKYRY
ncbi:unnamed protein product [Caretta caretta]